MMNTDPHESLSPQGEVRRDAMLADLTGAMQRLHRRRRMRRQMLSSTALVLLIVGVIRFSDFSGHQSAMTSRESPAVPITATTKLDAAITVYVHSDATIEARYRADSAPIVVWIDDAQLIRTLIEVGRPAGLIHIGDRLALSAPVTDDEIRMQNRDR
jgi:hypothetical protein